MMRKIGFFLSVMLSMFVSGSAQQDEGSTMNNGMTMDGRNEVRNADDTREQGYYVVDDNRMGQDRRYDRETSGYSHMNEQTGMGNRMMMNNGYDGQASYGDRNCCPPSEKACNDCYCLYCRYEPCYYNKTHCESVPKYSYKKCCRYVPQYYQKKCCRYVPQYYNETCCRQVPQYYYTCSCRYEPKYTTERCCKYVPKYYYKHTAASTCDENSCAVVR